MKCKPEYLEMLWRTPVLSRNVCIAGHLHHGKSSLVDAHSPRRLMFPEIARKYDDNSGFEYKRNCHKTILTRYDYYTDTRLDERSREMSIKAVPMTLPLADGKAWKDALDFNL